MPDPVKARGERVLAFVALREGCAAKRARATAPGGLNSAGENSVFGEAAEGHQREDTPRGTETVSGVVRCRTLRLGEASAVSVGCQFGNCPGRTIEGWNAWWGSTPRSLAWDAADCSYAKSPISHTRSFNYSGQVGKR